MTTEIIDSSENEAPADFGAGILANSSTFHEDAEVTLSSEALAHLRGTDSDEVEEEYDEEPNDVDPGSPDTPEPSGWTAEDLALADKYGISNSELNSFGSQEELQRAVKLVERFQTNLGDGSGDVSDRDAGDEPGAAPDQSPFEKIDVEAYEKVGTSEEDIANGIEPYDEQTLSLVRSLRKTQDALEQIVQQNQQQQTITVEQQRNHELFHAELDAHSEVFGDSKKLDDAGKAARQAIADEVEIIYAGLVAKKATIPDVKTIVQKAIRSVHGDLAAKKNQRNEAIVNQSRSVRNPGRSAAVTQRPTAPPDSAEAIAAIPQIKKFWQDAQRENGVY